MPRRTAVSALYILAYSASLWPEASTQAELDLQNCRKSVRFAVRSFSVDLFWVFGTCAESVVKV